MSYFETSQEWLKQSSMLLSVHPDTTRVSSKYTVEPYKPRPSKDASANADAQPKPEQTTSASFCLKTYDPVSGVCLKYKTNKAAEVGRLISSLGKLGRQMAALPGDVLDGEDTVMADAVDGTEAASAPNGQATKADAPTPQDQNKPAAGGGGGGGKKKKKGKK